MKGRTFFAVVASSLALTACYVESIDDPKDREKQGGTTTRTDGRNADDATQDLGQCRFTTQKGCFDGHVISKADFLVEGKQFFNADDLAQRFGELVTVQSLGERLQDGDDYKLELLTSVDNASFLQGFEYYLHGTSVYQGNVRSNGVFNVNEMPEGAYDLRIQKAIKFQLVRTVVKQPAQPQPQPVGTSTDTATATATATQTSTQPETETITKVFCATMYADGTVDVRRGKRAWDQFNEFRLHVNDKECPAAGSGAVVTVDR